MRAIDSEYDADNDSASNMAVDTEGREAMGDSQDSQEVTMKEALPLLSDLDRPLALIRSMCLLSSIHVRSTEAMPRQAMAVV